MPPSRLIDESHRRGQLSVGLLLNSQASHAKSLPPYAKALCGWPTTKKEKKKKKKPAAGDCLLECCFQHHGKQHAHDRGAATPSNEQLRKGAACFSFSRHRPGTFAAKATELPMQARIGAFSAMSLQRRRRNFYACLTVTNLGLSRPRELVASAQTLD